MDAEAVCANEIFPIHIHIHIRRLLLYVDHSGLRSSDVVGRTRVVDHIQAVEHVEEAGDTLVLHAHRRSYWEGAAAESPCQNPPCPVEEAASQEEVLGSCYNQNSAEDRIADGLLAEQYGLKMHN